MEESSKALLCVRKVFLYEIQKLVLLILENDISRDKSFYVTEVWDLLAIFQNERQVLHMTAATL